MAAASPDGKHIVFVRNDTEIWLADADGHNARQVSTAPTNFSIDRAPWMSVNGKYIVASAFNLRTAHSSIRAFPVDGTEQRVLYDGDAYIGGFVLIKDKELLVSQDVVRNDKTASEVIGMTVDLDVGDPAHGYFKVADWHEQGGYSNALSATPDGSIVALLNGKFAEQIAIADLDTGNDSITSVRLLTHSLQGHRLVQWLKDNKTVLFFAGAGDQYGLYLQSIDSDDVQRIATTASLNIRPAISPDERWLFYFVVDNSSFNPSFKLMQVPMTGGASKQVGIRHDAGWKIRCASSRNLCVMAENDGDQTVFTAYDPDHGRGLELAKLKWNDAGLSYDWDISADGNRIGYLIPRGATQLGATDVGIINLQQPAAAPQLLHFEHIDSMFTLRWAAEGDGLFAASQTLNSEMVCLLHLHLDGTSTPLYCEPNVPNTFGIGSADGKHIAFQKWSNNNNVWLLKRQTD
jgi:Tol biopolymer transport system component